MNITVNGVEETLSEPLTISDYLLKREVEGKSVVIELNGQIIKDESYDTEILKEGDSFEILRILGGG